MSNPLRVAVVGCWHVHASDYATEAQTHPETELVAVWDDDAERGRALSTQFDTAYVGDLDALLRREDVDAVTVTTSTNVHHDVMLRAAAAGKHIFTEKVLARTVAEAEAVVTACDSAGVALTVSLPRLYHGYTRSILGVIHSERLGELSHVRVRLSHDGATAGWLPEHFYDPAAAVGGALTDLGCHPLYLCQLFLGSRPATVSATYATVTGRSVEDQAVVTLGYRDGAIAVAETGFVSGDAFTIELHGRDGSLHYSSAAPGSGAAALLVADAGAASWQAVPVGADADSAFSQWVRHIRTGSRAQDNIARAVELTRLVVAANTSAADRITVAYG